jgi:Domain of unknown function (DUF4276)
MKLHILVEGKSERAFLDGWLPRFLPGHTFQVIFHRGKGHLSGSPLTEVRGRQGLLDQLPMKLRAFGRELDPLTDRVLVLVDADRDDCHELKRRLVELAGQIEPSPTVLFRIAVEETEAFYLGDSKAIRRAYSGAKVARLKGYEQDSICGTWERFMEVIGASSEDKVAWAEAMGRQLSHNPKDNRSPSFRQLCRALRRLAGEDDAVGQEPRPRTARAVPVGRRVATKRRR